MVEIQLLLEKLPEDIEFLTPHPFQSEDELEEFVIQHPEILGDLKVFARQIYSGDRRFRLDLLAIDGDGEIYIIEIKNNRPRGSQILYQTLEYVDWVKKNPLEIKYLWQNENAEDKEEYPEPDWENLFPNVVLIAPAFDPSFVRLIRNTQEISFRFLTIERYILENKSLYAIDHQFELDYVEDRRQKRPVGRKEYNWESYEKTHTNVTKKEVKQAKDIAEEVDEILKYMDLDWLRMKFNKYWVSYKNGNYNVIEICFMNDGTPGLGFYLPKPPSKKN